MRSIPLLMGAFLALCAAMFGAGAAQAGVDIYVDKASQRMTVTIDGVRRYDWKVSTGRAGYVTPSGRYTPFRLELDHFSQEWDEAPMPHSIFFTYQGHAIHGSYATARLGRPASHGCIRLAPQNAALLFSLVTRAGLGNTTITVADQRMAAASPRAPVTTTVRKPAAKAKPRFGHWLDRRQR